MRAEGAPFRAQFYRKNRLNFSLALLASLFSGGLERAERRVSERNDRLTATLKDSLSGFSVIKGFRAEAAMLSLFSRSNTLAEALSVSVRDEGSPIPERLERGIELRDVSFAYEPGREVLHGITVDFAPGRSTAAVGASGSGKSTLLRLLTAGHGSYTGEILIDGRELREISGGSLCELISVVEQNVFIFNASIRDNITMFQSFPQEEVERAIELSGLVALIEERGEGYLCGENGSGLSGGEKQRISIARSLIRRSQILLGGRGDGGAGRGFGPSGLERHPRPRLHDAHRRDPQPGRRAAAAL